MSYDFVHMGRTIGLCWVSLQFMASGQDGYLLRICILASLHREMNTVWDSPHIHKTIISPDLLLCARILQDFVLPRITLTSITSKIIAMKL